MEVLQPLVQRLMQPLVQRLIISLALSMPECRLRVRVILHRRFRDYRTVFYRDASNVSVCLMHSTLRSVCCLQHMFFSVAACYSRSRQLWLWLLRISSYTFLVERVRWR
jgi:hypothetical protein